MEVTPTPDTGLHHLLLGKKQGKLQKVDGSLGAVHKESAIAEIQPAYQDKELPPKLHLQTMSRLKHW